MNFLSLQDLPWPMLGVQVLTFLIVTSLVVLACSLLTQDRRVGRRFRAFKQEGDTHIADPDTNPDEESAESLARWDEARSRAWESVTARLVPDDEAEWRSLRQELARAGIYSRNAISRFAAIKILLMSCPMLICLLASMAGLMPMLQGVLAGAVGGMVGMLMPRWWLVRRQKRRHAIIRRSLPDFLDLMTCCIESGMGIQAALQRVADELRIAHPELAMEMGMVERESELGASVDQAMRHFAERSGLDCIRSLSTFMQQSQRFGTSIAEALRSHAELMRSQRELRAEEMAQKASVKILFPTLICIFPAIFVVLAGPAVIQLQERFPSQSNSVASSST